MLLFFPTSYLSVFAGDQNGHLSERSHITFSEVQNCNSAHSLPSFLQLGGALSMYAFGQYAPVTWSILYSTTERFAFSSINSDNAELVFLIAELITSAAIDWCCNLRSELGHRDATDEYQHSKGW